MSKRIIMHIDMNSYFASVEQQANPFLRGKPIGITGKRMERSVIATASIEAKRLGVKTAMSTWEAKRVCPSLMLWPGDPEKYAFIMHQFNKVYRSFTPHVDQFSVDESFLDVTDEAEDYFGATYMAQMIRQRLREVCGEHITASIGIAPNKLMAKLSSEHVKPNGLTVTPPDQVLPLLDQSKLEDLCGIGPRINARLEQMGISTFAQLRACDPQRLEAEFNSHGLWLHEVAHGHTDLSMHSSEKKQFIGSTEDLPKSVGHSYTLPADTTSSTVLKRYLLGLCDKVAWRLRRDGLLARRIHVSVRYKDFGAHGRQQSLNEPIHDGLSLFKTAWHMIDTFRDQDVPIRFLGISASGLLQAPEQQPLFKKSRNMSTMLRALDKVQTRYGSGAWTRAALLPINLKARSSGFHFDHEL